MEKRTLGRTGLEVTILGYGAMALRGPKAWDGQDLTEENAGQILNTLLDAGINFVDTAPDYGISEQLIGAAISHRRDAFHLASKCGCNIPRDDGPDMPKHIWTRDRLLKNIELSLQRMKTEWVDIWQMHNPDPESVQAEDLVKVMEDVQRQGKVRHVAISSTLPHISTYIDWGVFDSFQIPYSALERQHENIITSAAEAGAGTIIRGGVAKGEPDGDLGANQRWSKWKTANLDELCAEGETRSAFLLRFTITHPHVHTTIVGTRNPAHLSENLRAAEAGPLSAEVYAEAKRRLESLGEVPQGE